MFITAADCILMALFAACSDSGHGRAVGSLPSSGEVHKSIPCVSDPGISYALYIPGETPPPPPPVNDKTLPPTPPQTGRGELGKRLYPVMVAFDPHGDGVLPVTLYRDLADRYGFILIGSNDSRNGIPGEKVSEIIAALMHEVRSVYPVDTNRIYLLGFSGGARIAPMAAMYMVQVKGVIGCGAGFGTNDQPVRYKFDYYGIAGTADFNLNELQQMEEPLSRAGFRHFIATFAGKHEWPPLNVLEDAFRWITLNAMRDGMIKRDSVYISSEVKLFEARGQELTGSNQLIAAAGEYRKAIAFTEGLASDDSVAWKLSNLESRAEYKRQAAYHLKVMKKEAEEKQELVDALETKDLVWWKKRLKNYDSPLTTHHSRLTTHDSRLTTHDSPLTTHDILHGSLNPEDTLKNRRLLSFLSLYCYMNANAAVVRQDENAAAKIIAIYGLADPANPEPNYMKAILSARRSEKEATFSELKLAISKGFSDKERLGRQPEFVSFSSSPEWSDLLKTMK